MRDFGEYLLAYRTYVSANLGWLRALVGALVWLAGMLIPLWAKAFVQLPNWLAITWMVGWALLGYVFTGCGNISALKFQAQITRTVNSCYALAYY